MKKFIVEEQMNNNTDGYYAVVIEGEEHLNRTVIKSDIQFFTTQGGYDYCHPWQRAKEYAESIAMGLNEGEKRKELQGKYCIISLKHTSVDFVCFWRPNDAGYTEILSEAGLYDKIHVQNHSSYYNNGESTLALPILELMEIFETTERIKNGNILKELKEKLTNSLKHEKESN